MSVAAEKVSMKAASNYCISLILYDFRTHFLKHECIARAVKKKKRKKAMENTFCEGFAEIFRGGGIKAMTRCRAGMEGFAHDENLSFAKA